MAAIGIFAGIFILDLLLKRCAEYRLRAKERRELFGGRVLLRRCENPGVALGFLKKQKKTVLWGTFSFLAALTVIFLRIVRQPGRTGEKLGLALLLGGGWNNWTDRAVKGSVTDYISFRTGIERLDRIVFNLSDFAIFIGTALTALARGRRS